MRSRRRSTGVAFDGRSAVQPESIGASERGRLAESQERLVAALTGAGPVPPGFDPEGVTAARTALSNKRERAVASVFPATAAALGPRFAPLFAMHARAVPLPAAGPRADGELFLEGLHCRGELPENSQVDRFWCLIRRRIVAFVWLPEKRQLLAGVRIGSRVRVMALAFGLRPWIRLFAA
jgi:hypothetical protein